MYKDSKDSGRLSDKAIFQADTDDKVWAMFGGFIACEKAGTLNMSNMQWEKISGRECDEMGLDFPNNKEGADLVEYFKYGMA